MGKKWVKMGKRFLHSKKLILLLPIFYPCYPCYPFVYYPFFTHFTRFAHFTLLFAAGGLSHKNVLKIRTGTVRSPPIKMGKLYPFFTHFLPISYTAVQVLISVLRQLYLFLYSLELSYKK